MEIGFNSALQIFEEKKVACNFVFVKPSSLKVLRERLLARGGIECEEELLNKRIGEAEKEIALAESDGQKIGCKVFTNGSKVETFIDEVE